MLTWIGFYIDASIHLVLCLIIIVFHLYYHTFDLLVSLNLFKCYILLHVSVKVLTSDLRGISVVIFYVIYEKFRNKK